MEELISPKESFEITPYVAVYGTLKYGYSNHHFLEGALAIKTAYTLERFKLFDVGYPYAKPSQEGFPLQVEVYLLPNWRILEKLDRLEGYPTHYQREPVKVVGRDGKIEYAWLYYTETPEGDEIKNPYLDEVVGIEYLRWGESYLLLLEELTELLKKCGSTLGEVEILRRLKKLTEFLLVYEGPHNAVFPLYEELAYAILRRVRFSTVVSPTVLGFLLAFYKLSFEEKLPKVEGLEEFIANIFQNDGKRD